MRSHSGTKCDAAAPPCHAAGRRDGAVRWVECLVASQPDCPGAPVVHTRVQLVVFHRAQSHAASAASVTNAVIQGAFFDRATRYSHTSAVSGAGLGPGLLGAVSPHIFISRLCSQAWGVGMWRGEGEGVCGTRVALTYSPPRDETSSSNLFTSV